ncbi:Gluconolactonase [plant metagenome]|uniref:Gluconolactonase n=1 Tax=plant metagenome TaxID=1297885 RepID=A0A484QSL2_9ZZZZ
MNDAPPPWRHGGIPFRFVNTVSRMFLLNAPLVSDLALFTSLPEAFRRHARSDWADANRGGTLTDSFLEGPVFDRAGNLYVTDIPWGRIFRIDPAGEWTLVAEYDGEPNGMKFLDSGTLLITDYKNGLMQLDIASGKVAAFLARRNSERFKGVNDLVFDTAGNLYFTDQGQSGLHDPSGRLYRLRPSGQLDLLLANVPSPNGVALSPDERVLYLAVTRGNCVWRVPLLPDGSVAKVSQFFTSHGASGPDGLAVDQQGRLLVANPGLGYVWVLNHRAEPVQVLRGPEGCSTTNLAFGGADGRDLYVTNATHGQILRARLDVAGLPLSSGASH